MEGADASSTVINVYAKYPRSKNEKIVVSSTDPFNPKRYVDSITNPTANPAIHSQYDSRVKGKHVHLENPQKESRLTKERKEKRARREKHQARKKLGVMGRKEAKLKGVWTLPPEDAKWEKFLILHRMWLGYMSELLELPSRPPVSSSIALTPKIHNPASMQAKLVKADFHGSIITVKDAKNACLVGCSGIVIHETENTFKVVTQKDKVKVIPKAKSIFAFHLPLYDIASYDKCETDTETNEEADSSAPRLIAALPSLSSDPLIAIDLYGNQFCFRSADRASKKFKAKETIEL